jgi:PAS domain-containing protein
LPLVAAGLANKAIADQIGLSEVSVKQHVSNLLRVLSVSNRAALAEAGATLRLIGTTDIDRDWLGVLFEQSPIHIAVFSGPEHTFVAANAAYRRAAGGRALIGRPFRDAFPGLEGEGVYELFDRVLHDGRTITRHELPGRFDRGRAGRTEDGFATVVMHPLAGPDGRPTGVAVLSIDVTDHVRARASSSRSEGIARHVPAARSRSIARPPAAGQIPRPGRDADEGTGT